MPVQILTKAERKAIIAFCKAGTQVEVPTHKNAMWDQVASFKFWAKGDERRAYLNVKDEGTKRMPISAGYINLVTGEIKVNYSSPRMETDDAYWNKIYSLFADVIASEAAA